MIVSERKKKQYFFESEEYDQLMREAHENGISKPLEQAWYDYPEGNEIDEADEKEETLEKSKEVES